MKHTQTICVAFLTAHLLVLPIESACARAATSAVERCYTKQDTWHDTLIAWHLARSRRPETAVEPAPLPDFGDSEFTISAWIRTTKGGTIMARCPAADWAPQGKTFFVRGGRLAFDIGWVGVITGNATVADGRWHHVALTGGGNTFTLYVNGQRDAYGMLAAEPDPKTYVVRIGYTCDDFPSPTGFDGDIDDLRLYDKQLTPEQIRALSSNPEAIARTALVGCWPFDGDGTDASASNNHAVNITGAQFTAGKVGQALRLKGKDRVDLPAEGLADLSGAVWQLLERDFTDPDARRQMEWVYDDGIWQRPWPVGDWRDLAGRYAEAARAPDAFAARAKEAAQRAGSLADVTDVLQLYYNAKRYEQLDEILARTSPARLRKTLREDFDAAQASQVDAFASRIASIERQIQAWQTQLIDPARLEQFTADLQGLQRDIIRASDPFSTFDRILFVKRYTYQSSHYYTDFIDGCEKFGGNLCTLDLNTGEVAEIVPSLAHGIFGRYDLSFDVQRIVFAWKEKIGKGFRLYEVNVDGTGLRQLTFDPPDEPQRIDRYWRRDMDSWAGRPILYRHHTDDMDPAYLPDGGICFISTRCEYGILCDGPDYFTTTVLYRMDADGGNMEKLSNSSVSEAYPTVANDGRILYTRWEYVDKGAVSTKCLWAMYPDGTASVEIYGNDIAVPSAFIQGRPIPNTNNQFIVIGGPHCCPVNGIGTVIRLDMAANYRTEQPMTYITPDIRMTPNAHNGFLHLRDGKWVQDTRGPLFIDPYPLNDKLFLVSQNADRQWREFDAWDLYLLDETGATLLLHDDPEISCYQPMPLRPRLRPPILTGARNEQLADENLAEVIVADVYQGLEGIARGRVRYIRINEQMPRPWAARRTWPGDEYDQQHACITRNTHLGLKVQHGIVPVYPDGSAHFLVPADRNIFFQVLDENFMELQRERTFVNYRPGEVRSCVGCHEKNIDAPPRGAKMPLALLREPDRPGPQPGEATGARPIHYPTDVQPVLDKHCIKCHGGPEPKAGLDLTGTPTALFCRSYENILDRKLLPVIGENHPKSGNIHYLPPESLGSHASKLVAHLKKGHNNIQLTQAEWVRLTTWVDSNGQYYGSYYGRRNLRYKDHPNFRPPPTFAQAVSTKAPLPEDAR